MPGSSLSQTAPPPPGLVGITPLGFMFYPTYRLALLGIVAVALIASTSCSIAPASA
jgi:branched-chain amino acid transport system permease protein